MFTLIFFVNSDLSIPSLESLVTEEDKADLDKLKIFIELQTKAEEKFQERIKQERAKLTYPNPQTECKAPRYLKIPSHYYYYSIIGAAIYFVHL